MERIGFIGGGAMAEAIIKGLLRSGKRASDIVVSDKVSERLDYLSKTYGISIFCDNIELAQCCSVIILAVKPQNLQDALAEFSTFAASDRLYISILAGVATANIEALLTAKSKVVRAMPNTPALIGAGTTVITGGLNATQDDIMKAADIFASVGSVTELPEKLLNAVTGLSGSGPAYIYVIIEALSDGGVLAGLPRDVAYKLACETVKGAAMMVTETKLHPGFLKDMVTSPAGTTISGLLQMEKAGIRGSIMEAVMASCQRAEQLSK